jgi:hypothetical protein
VTAASLRTEIHAPVDANGHALGRSLLDQRPIVEAGVAAEAAAPHHAVMSLADVRCSWWGREQGVQDRSESLHARVSRAGSDPLAQRAGGADPRNASRECNNRRCVMNTDAFRGVAGMDHRPKLTHLRLFEASAGKQIGIAAYGAALSSCAE